MRLEQLEVVLSANADKYRNQLNQVQARTTSMANVVNSKVNSINASFSKLGKILAGVLSAAALVKFTKDCLDAGSNLAEVQNVVDVTFGSMSNKVNEFAKNAWKTIGLSETMAKKYMGNFGAMSKSMGFAVNEAEKMGEQLTNLSGDVASFYNISQDEAYTKLKSVFTGETESLKELGVVMTQENLNAFAMANGFGKTIDAMNQQEKVALRLAYVTQNLSAANGDFARTSGGWANQVRLLSLQFQSLKASIGQGLIAVFTPVIKLINTIIGKLIQMANTFNSVLGSLGFNVSGGSSGSDATGGMGAIADGIDDATGAMDNLGTATDGVGNSAKKAKKQMEALMGIDEINKIKSSDDSSDTGDNGGSAGTGTGAIGSISSPAIDTSATENSLNNLNSRVKGLLQELLSPLKTAWESYGPWFLDKWEYFKDAFGYSCDALKTFLISVWKNGGKEFVQHLAEIGLAVGGVALQIGGDILIALGNLWNHLNPYNNPYTKAFINAMNSLAESVRDFIISAGNWFGQFLNLGGQAFLNTVGDIVMIVGTTLAETLTGVIKFVKAFMDSWAGHAVIQACALALDVAAGAVKAVAVIIEKCHGVLSGLLMVWGAWKFTQVIKGVTDVTTRVGKLAYKFVGLGISIGDNIKQSLKWAGTLTKNVVKGITSVIKHIGKFILKIAEWSIKTGVEAVKAAGKFIASMGEQVLGLLGLTAAEGTAAGGATLLKVALDALGIGLVIAAIAGLIVVVKKIGDKFGWWKAISNALGKVFGWLGDKVSGIWGGIKSFFGWDSGEVKCKESIEGVGDAATEAGEEAEEAAKTTDEAFGSASSNVNKYLDSIHFNATRLGEEVTAAAESANEKFGMLSKNAQEYLDAIKDHNSEKLAEMGDNQATYNEEVKAMYSDLTLSERNEFLKRYGIVQGVNDDMLNYEGLSYDERVARHSAYIESIENDDTLNYQQKKEKIDQSNLDFNQMLDSFVQENSMANNTMTEDTETALKTQEEDHKSFLEGLKNEWNGFVNFVDGAWNGLCSFVNRKLSGLSDSWNGFVNFIKGLWSGGVDHVSNKWNSCVQGVNNGCQNVKNVFNNAVDGIRNGWSRITNFLSSPIESARSKISGIMDNIKNLFKFDWSLPHIKLPHFSISGSSNPFKWIEQGVPRISVSYYAKGGIMNSPTLLGMTGNRLNIGGEAGREAILPLDRNTDWMDTIASKVVNSLPQSNSGGKTRVVLPIYVGGRKVTEKVIEDINSITKSTGECPIMV